MKDSYTEAALPLFFIRMLSRLQFKLIKPFDVTREDYARLWIVYRIRYTALWRRI